MTDSTQVEAPVEAPAAEGMSDFDKNLEQFLNYNTMEETPDGEPLVDPNTHGVDEAPQVNTVGVKPAAAPALESSGNVTQVAPGNTTVTGNVTGDLVDPALVIEMMGLGKDKPALTTASPTPAPAPTAPIAAPADQPYAPFRSDFELPQALNEALFESEDSATRSKALTAVLSAAMNAVAQHMDQRIKEFYQPQFVENYEGQQQQRQQGQAFLSDFYHEGTGFPDLQSYGKVVQRAIEVLAGVYPPETPWTEMKPRVAALARKTVAQITGTPEVTGNGKVTKAAPPKNAQHDAFLAGGARPAGAGEPVDQTSAAAVFADLTQF